MKNPDPLIKVIAQVERALPVGWCWLLRSDDERGGYFANITNGTPRPLTFPSYHADMASALANSLDGFLSFKKKFLNE